MPVPITSLYLVPLAVLFLVLSARVITLRLSAKIALGVGGDKQLERRMRVHANFAEYTPLALIGMGLAEINGAAPLALHGIGLALVVGRLFHAIGVSRQPEVLPLRVSGMVLTLTVILVSAILAASSGWAKLGW
jgi:uncharacterized protein